MLNAFNFLSTWDLSNLSLVRNLEVQLNELHKVRIILVTYVCFEYSGDLVAFLRYFQAGFWASLDFHRSKLDLIFRNENEYFDVKNQTQYVP